MENQIQQQVAVLRELQINAGIPATQWARNVLPMRKLVRIAIAAASTRAMVDGKEFYGLSMQGILRWLKANGFGASAGSVSVTLTQLKSQNLVSGGFLLDEHGNHVSSCYFWTNVH